jgi:GntR family transcriptional regulator
VKQLDNVPLVERAREAILDAILADEFGGRLPSEERLAKMLNVSRTTVRAAVQDLEREGLITRKRAVGTKIRPNVGSSILGLQRLVGFDRMLTEQGHDVRVDIEWRRGSPRPVVAALLPWDEQSDLCVIEKSYFADDDLAIYIEDYLPWSTLRSADPGSRVEASLFEFSRRNCKHPIDHAVVRIVPMRDDGTGRVTRLALRSGAPFIRLHETHYADSAAVVGWSLVDFDDRLARLEVFRNR